MKKLVILGAIGLISTASFAQDKWGDVPVYPDSYGQKIGKDGVIIAGETSDGGYFSHNLQTGAEYSYYQCHGGNGNCIASNGWVVGSDKTTSKAVIMADGKTIAIGTLNKYSESYLHGITWDGSRICGLMINPDIKEGEDFTNPEFNKQMYVPVIIDVDENGNFSEPLIIPHPEKDIFKAVPQFCSAIWISDDGKTVAGQVIDNSGQYMYPIIYTEGENGDWTYSFPAEKLFNQDNAPVPDYPPFEMEVYDVEDFMSPENAERFKEDLEFWAENGFDPADDPYDLLDQYMTPAQLQEYETWYEEYQQYSYYYSNVLLVEYYNALTPVIKSSVFFKENCMTMNAEGTMMASSQVISFILPGDLYPIEYSIPWMFDLTDNTYKKLGDDTSTLNTNQILPDGTLIVATPVPGSYSPDATPVHSYVYLPGGNGFISVADWIGNVNAGYAEWLHEYLYHSVPIGVDEEGNFVYKELVITGLVAMSDDKSVVAGGVDTWSWESNAGNYYTYILSDVMAGINDVAADTDGDGRFRVYNMQGVNVLNTTDRNDLNNLPKGLYIINGKKIML